MSRKVTLETAAGLIAAALFAATGAAIILLGAHLYLERAELLSNGQRATGFVSGFERVGGPLGPDTLTETIIVPVVKFTTPSGEEITFLGSTDTKPPWADYQSGGTVAVVFDPQHPQAARIDTFAEIWFAPFLLWFVGAGALLIPPFTIWRHFRAKRPVVAER